MSGVIRYEAWLLMLSLATGGWLMLVYDTIRVFRLMIRHSAFAVGLEDFFYWIGAGVVTFNLLYQQNDGGLRAYVIGGVLGGISDGSELIVRAAIKPTPSIARPQSTVNIDKEEIEISIKGRHDPIIVPRAVVVVESMTALTLADLLLCNMCSRLDSIKNFYQEEKDV